MPRSSGLSVPARVLLVRSRGWRVSRLMLLVRYGARQATTASTAPASRACTESTLRQAPLHLLRGFSIRRATSHQVESSASNSVVENCLVEPHDRKSVAATGADSS